MIISSGVLPGSSWLPLLPRGDPNASASEAARRAGC